MWKYYAVLSAIFAALTAIFAKIGIKNVDSNLATAIRTCVILLLTWSIAVSYTHLNRAELFWMRWPICPEFPLIRKGKYYYVGVIRSLF